MASTIHVSVGPVPAAGARHWIENSLRIVRAVRTQPDKIPFNVPGQISDAFEAYLHQMLEIANAGDTFLWEAEEEPSRLRVLLTYWLNIDRLSDENMETLGVAWSGPEGRPFFEAITSAIISALVLSDELADFGARLQEIWT